tara:strand:- start:1232 stop:2230 length:999 start_codon:yes stop_codon:yes gene_type:complete
MEEIMRKILLLTICVSMFGYLGAQESVTYGIKYNNETKKNEIYRTNDDGTETFLIEFEFPTGGWVPANSYADDKDGKLYLWDANNNQRCTGGAAEGPLVCTDVAEEDRGYVVYDPATNTIEKGVKRGYGGNYQKTFQSVFALDDLISEETNGEIHIGENSLVTIEQDGKQQLYATDANGDQIDINIKKGSDLLVDGKSVSQAITDVATNKTNIATNTTNIATNTQAITSLGTRVDGLTNLVNTFDQRITDLQTLTGTMMSEYRSGIASSVALSQIRYASKGFSIGVGQGEFKDKDEMAVGIGYGGEFNDRVGYQFQFGSSGDTSGFGFTITF